MAIRQLVTVILLRLGVWDVREKARVAYSKWHRDC